MNKTAAPRKWASLRWGEPGPEWGPRAELGAAPAVSEARRRARSAIFIAGAAVSVVWLALSAWYVQTQIGWLHLCRIPPHPLGAALGGAPTPLPVPWPVVAVLERALRLQ